MLKVDIDEAHGVAVLVPGGPLSTADFESAASAIDPYIERTGSLNGLVIHAESFPGWDSFAALASHLRFVKAHHEHIARVALATDSAIGNLAQTLAGHFVSAQVKRFDYAQLDAARRWAGSTE